MLLIPLGPEDREVRRWPWVTIGIVALNVFVFALDPPGLDSQWGFFADHPSLWTAVTAAFVHADFWHLAWNMIFLLATGPFLEDAYGRVLFPAIYLGSAISGNYVWGELAAGRFHYGIGASGAIFGVEGAFAIRYGTRHLRFFLAPIGFLPFWAFESACGRPSCFCCLHGAVGSRGNPGEQHRLRRTRGRIRVWDAGGRRRLGPGNREALDRSRHRRAQLDLAAAPAPRPGARGSPRGEPGRRAPRREAGALG